MNLVTKLKRGYSWVVGAHRLGDGEAPQALLQEIRPTLDLVQGGWGHTETRTYTKVWTASITTAGTYDLITGLDLTAPTLPSASLDHIIILNALSCQGINNATYAIDTLLKSAPGITGAPIIHSRVTVPPDGDAVGWDCPAAAAGSESYMPFGPIRVPRGYRPQLQLLGYGGAGDIEVTVAWTVMAQGMEGAGAR